MELRRAVPADALAVARVHVRGWQAGYRGHTSRPFELWGERFEELAWRRELP